MTYWDEYTLTSPGGIFTTKKKPHSCCGKYFSALPRNDLGLVKKHSKTIHLNTKFLNE